MIIILSTAQTSVIMSNYNLWAHANSLKPSLRNKLYAQMIYFEDIALEMFEPTCKQYIENSTRAHSLLRRR